VAYYAISEVDLRKLIAAESRNPAGETWFDKAGRLHGKNMAAGKLVEKSAIWSDIKAIYTTIQRFKCAYCELELGGSATQHLEHYRPKAKVTKWPRKTTPEIDFPVGSGRLQGYYWLAYDPLNYAVACAHCNSSLKGNAFPIAGAPAPGVEKVRKLNSSERPLLLQPFGNWGDDPEDYIDFDEILACPKAGLSSGKRNRALTTIEFFRLNKEKHLLDSRRRVARFMFRSLEARRTASSAQEAAEAQGDVNEFKKRSSPQSLFARCYEGLYLRDQGAAQRVHDAAVLHLDSIGDR
jgi:hypothetical protein